MRIKIIGLIVIWSFILACTNTHSNSSEEETVFEEGEYTLLKNARLFDGVSTSVFDHYSVLIKDNLIYSVSPDSVIAYPESAKIIDLKGKFLSPGLIDSHGHQTFTDPVDTAKVKLEKLLYGGILGIRNMAGRVPSYNDWIDKIETGNWRGPYIYTSALFAGQKFFNNDGRLKKYTDFGSSPGSETWMHVIDSETDITKVVGDAKTSGVNGIKLYAQLNPKWVNEIVSAAKEIDLPVWTHAHLELCESEQIVESGVRSISHAAMLSRTINQQGELINNWVIDSSRVNAIFNLMIENEVFFDVTLELYVKYPRSKEERAFAVKIVKMAHESGVKIVAGSDSEGFWEDGTIALYDELKALVRDGGLTELEALKAATYNPARLLGIDKMYGSVEVGKKANIVIFDKDPSKDINNIQYIYMAIKEGVIYQ